MSRSGVLGGRIFSQPSLTSPEITPAAVPAINVFFKLNFEILGYSFDGLIVFLSAIRLR